MTGAQQVNAVTAASDAMRRKIPQRTKNCSHKKIKKDKLLSKVTNGFCTGKTYNGHIYSRRFDYVQVTAVSGDYKKQSSFH